MRAFANSWLEDVHQRAENRPVRKPLAESFGPLLSWPVDVCDVAKPRDDLLLVFYRVLKTKLTIREEKELS